MRLRFSTRGPDSEKLRNGATGSFPATGSCNGAAHRLLALPVPIVFGNVRSWAEHALTRPGHPLTQTRTVTSNRVVSFLMCNLNYHLEHHLFPGVPWYNLPRLHALLADEYRRAGAQVHRS